MAGNLTTKERIERLSEIKDLQEQGMTAYEISNTIGMSIQAVKRNLKRLTDLDTSGLTTEEITEKRNDLNAKLTDAAEKAKDLFIKYSAVMNIKEGELAVKYHQRWVDTLMNIAKIFGLDNVKVDSFTQINNQSNTYNEGAVDLSDTKRNQIADIIASD